MTKKHKSLVAGLVSGLLWTTNAFAFGGFGGGDGGGGGDSGGGGGDVVGNPEIDGPGALLVVALLASVAVMIYRNAQK